MQNRRSWWTVEILKVVENRVGFMCDSDSPQHHFGQNSKQLVVSQNPNIYSFHGRRKREASSVDYTNWLCCVSSYEHLKRQFGSMLVWPASYRPQLFVWKGFEVFQD